MTYTTELTINDTMLQIRFSDIPPVELRRELKTSGFSWSPAKQHWIAKTTPERKSLVQSLSANRPRNTIIEGDCLDVMQRLSDQTVDLVVTDPPYLVNYKDRSGRSIQGDNDGSWVKPAFAGLYRLLKPNSFCVSFCGWNSIGTFMTAFKQAGFRPVGHIVWQKKYASSCFYLAAHHEQAIVLAKGYPQKPENPLKSVLPWSYTGNVLHPTQKHVDVILPLIETFSQPADIVLDPFCGSGTTLAAARELGRDYIGIEKDPSFSDVAQKRLNTALP